MYFLISKVYLGINECTRHVHSLHIGVWRFVRLEREVEKNRERKKMKSIYFTCAWSIPARPTTIKFGMIVEVILPHEGFLFISWRVSAWGRVKDRVIVFHLETGALAHTKLLCAIVLACDIDCCTTVTNCYSARWLRSKYFLHFSPLWALPIDGVAAVSESPVEYSSVIDNGEG